MKRILSAGRDDPIEFVSDTKALLHYEVLQPLVDQSENGGFPNERWEIYICVSSKLINMTFSHRDAYKSIDNTRHAWPDGYGKPLELVFGKRFQWPALERCVGTMLVDEVLQTTIDTMYCCSCKHQFYWCSP